MTLQTIAYLIFGAGLAVTFLVIIVFYYSRHRHTKVEGPKYTMLDDDD